MNRIFALKWKKQWKNRPHDVYNAIRIIIRFENRSVDVTFGYLIESSNFDVRNVLFVWGFFFISVLGRCKLNLLLLHCLHFLSLWAFAEFSLSFYFSLSFSFSLYFYRFASTASRVHSRFDHSCCFQLFGFCMSVRFLYRISVHLLFLFLVVVPFCLNRLLFACLLCYFI